MKRDIRMIAVDLDGTLLTTQKEISPEDRLALAEAVARGIRVVPVTGRNFSFALPAVAPLGLDLTLICSNGAVIRTSRGETHYQRLLPSHTAATVLARTRPFRPYTVLMYDHQGPGQLRLEHLPENGTGDVGTAARSDERVRPAPGLPAQVRPAPNLPAQVRPAPNLPVAPRPIAYIASTAWARKNRHRLHYVPSLEDSIDSDPLEILFAGPAGIIRDLVSHLLGSFPGTAFLDTPSHASADPDCFSLLRTEYPHNDFSMLDIIHGECSKGRALAAWSQSQGIGPEQIMAIGDNYNDLEMLRYAGLGVVMENAGPELKQMGWPVTRDCNSSGVAHALRTYVL